MSTHSPIKMKEVKSHEDLERVFDRIRSAFQDGALEVSGESVTDPLYGQEGTIGETYSFFIRALGEMKTCLLEGTEVYLYSDITKFMGKEIGRFTEWFGDNVIEKTCNNYVTKDDWEYFLKYRGNRPRKEAV